MNSDPSRADTLSMHQRGDSKPALVYFQCEYDRRLPAFLIRHAEEHVRCLSEFFNVIVVHEDCNYVEVCDTYQPDMVLVEGGVPFGTCKRPRVQNKRAYPTVPKAGLLNADAFGEGRAAFLSDMEEWGITTFFTIATAGREYNPGLAESLFFWPNFIDQIHIVITSSGNPFLFYLPATREHCIPGAAVYSVWCPRNTLR